MFHLPNYIKLNGIGIFSSDDFQVEASFDLQLQFSHLLLTVQGQQFGYASILHEEWTLTGQLEGGRPIQCERLCLVKLINGELNQAEFSPLAGVAIGNNMSTSPLAEARYPLIGLFEGKTSLQDDGWLIELIDGEEDAKLAEGRSKAWRIPMEGLTLRLSHKQATYDKYFPKARQIMQLLSLACGNGVTSHRQIASWDGQGEYEVWQLMTGDEFGPGPCVPSSCLRQFLEQILPAWRAWTKEKQEDARLAISYINLSSTGYLDTRLFQIMQVWELLSKAWGKEVELSDTEKSLKSYIKCGYKKWREEHINADPKGYWGGRITFPFKWPQAKRQMEAFAETRGINTVKLGLDFEKLKKARDSVAHTGKLPEEMVGNDNEAFKQLTAAQYGLQLLLLVELGYSGLVMGKNGWKSFVKITEVFG
jgi:hypothetical protein